MYIYMYTHTDTYIYTHLTQEEILAEAGMILGNWFPQEAFIPLGKSLHKRFCMFLFHEHGVEGKLLHCPLPNPHPYEMGVSYLLPLGHSGAH